MNEKDREIFEKALGNIDGKYIEEAAAELANNAGNIKQNISGDFPGNKTAAEPGNTAGNISANSPSEASGRSARSRARNWGRYAAVACMSLVIIGAAVAAGVRGGRNFYSNNKVQSGFVREDDSAVMNDPQPNQRATHDKNEAEITDRTDSAVQQPEGKTGEDTYSTGNPKSQTTPEKSTQVPPEPTAAPTSAPTPEATGEPVDEPADIGAETLSFSSFEELNAAINAARGQADPIGTLTNYYVPESVPEGAELMIIEVNTDLLAIYYNTAERPSAEAVFVWSRKAIDTDEYNALTGDEQVKVLYEKITAGQEIGEYGADGRRNVYWASNGYVYHAIVPENLTDAEVKAFCSAVEVTP